MLFYHVLSSAGGIVRKGHICYALFPKLIRIKYKTISISNLFCNAKFIQSKSFCNAILKIWFGTNLYDLLDLKMHVPPAFKMAHCFSIRWKKKMDILLGFFYFLESLTRLQ